MKLVEIESIEEFEYCGEVYDLNIDEDHSYNVYDIIVHNSDFVMLGSMLAGTDQGGGEVITKYYQTNEYYVDEKGVSQFVNEVKHFVQFYGMSSKTANEKHFGGLKEYRSSEGRTVMIPYKGSVNTVIQDILGGLRSTMTYVGAQKLKHLSKCTTFVRCSQTHNRVHEKNTVGN